MTITWTPAPQVIHRFEDGVRLITGEPHMDNTNEPQRYVYIEPNHRWFYDTITHEIRSIKHP